MRLLRPAAIILVVGVALVGCSSADTSAPTNSETPTGGPSAGCTEPDEAFAQVGENGTFEHGGEERTFSLAVPPDAAPNEPLPLVVALHGAGGSSEQMEVSAGFGELGREQGFVVLTPQARGDTRIWDVQPSGPDVQYLEDLLDEVEGKLCIDTDRVNLTGFSMGGVMSLTLACRDPERIAAVAPVAGVVQIDGCDPSTTVPLLAMHGTADDAMRFDGTFAPNVGFLVGTAAGPSREALVDSWAEQNGCAPDAATTKIEPDVEHLTYACPVGGSVEMYIVDDGGHTWPGSESTPYGRAVAGKTTQAIDGTRVIWDFFQQHARAG